MSNANALETLIVELALKVDDLQSKLDSTMNQAEARAKSGGRAIENAIRSSVQASTVALQALGLAIGGIGIAGAGMAINLAMKFEQAKIAFTSFLGDATKAQQFIEELQAFAARTPFTFSGLQKASQQLLAFGFEAKAIIPTMTAIGGAVAKVGGSEEAINRVTRALTQMLSSGRLSAEEMNQLADAGIQAWPMLAEKMGKSIAEVRKMAEKGAISGAQAVQILLEGMSVGAEQFLKDQAATMAGLMSNAKDSIEISLAIIGQEIIDTFDLKTKLAGAIEAMGTFTDLLKEKGLRGAFLEIFPPDTHMTIIAIAGAIGGALVPALVALGVAVGGVLFWLAPFMIAGAALAALAYQTRDSWMPIAQDVLPQLGQAFAWFADVAGQAVQWVGNEFDVMGRNIRTVQSFVLNTLAGIIDFLNPWVITIVYFWQLAGQKFAELGFWIQSVIQADIVPELNFFASVATSVVNWIRDRLTDLANKFAEVSNFVIPIINGIGAALVWLAGKIPILSGVMQAVGRVGDFISRMQGQVAESQSALSNELSNLTDEMRMNADAAEYLATVQQQEVQPELEDTFQTVQELESIMAKEAGTVGNVASTFSGQYVPAAAMAQGATDGLGKATGRATKAAKDNTEALKEQKTALEELGISASMMRDAMELAGIDTERQTMALINLGVAAVDAGPLLEGLNVTVDKLALAFKAAGLSAEDMQRTLDAISAKQAAAAQEKLNREAEAARREHEEFLKKQITAAELLKEALPTTDPIEKFRERTLSQEEFFTEEAQAMFDDWIRQFSEFGRDASIILERISTVGSIAGKDSITELERLFLAWEQLPAELQVGLDEAKDRLKTFLEKEITGAELAREVYPTTDPIAKFMENILAGGKTLDETAQWMVGEWTRQFTEFGRDAGIILDRIFDSGTLGNPSSVAEIERLFKAWEELPPELQVGLDEAKKLLLDMIEEFNLNLDGTVDLAKRNREAMIKIWDEQTEIRIEIQKGELQRWKDAQQKIIDDSVAIYEKQVEAARYAHEAELALYEMRKKRAREEADREKSREMARKDLQQRLISAVQVAKQFRSNIADAPMLQAIATHFQLGIEQLMNRLQRNGLLAASQVSRLRGISSDQTMSMGSWQSKDLSAFHSGGIVNAARGVSVPAILEGQERVITADQNEKIEQLLANILSATKAGHVLDVDGKELGRTASVGIRRRGTNIGRMGG